MKAKLKKVADRIVKIEKECQLGINVHENMIAMEKLTANLSPEEMVAIDEYIAEKGLLTK